jgi:hypothetical protein
MRSASCWSARADLSIDDLMALVAGCVHTLQYAGVNAKSHQAQRPTAVLFDGLRPSGSATRDRRLVEEGAVARSA